MRLIKKLLVNTISPPEESGTKLLITHTNHESTNDECLEATIENHNMSSLHSRNNFSLYSIEKICRLHEETGFWKNAFVEFFEILIGSEEVSKDWSCFPGTHGDFMSFFFEHFFECLYLGSFPRAISTLEYDEGSWKCMTVTNIWTHMDWFLGVGDL